MTDLTYPKVRAIIQSELKLVDIPLNQSFHDLGFSNNDLNKIQIRLVKSFNRTVSTLFFADTIYTLTDRLNGKHS